MSDVFEGTDRFRIIRRLGEGGMGVVYLAHDRLRDAEVALKTLRRDSPYGILRLKSEFRSLAEIAHPNLIDLHDLHENDGTWFFTMEYLDGVDFNEWVRPTVDFGGEAQLDERRLRHALRQLVRGVSALHAAGHLHRDLKPSNVMVENGSRRLVILDFGLVTPLHGRRTQEVGFSGTLEYMAPEQADGDPPAPASDWYGVGVVLFEAMTGRLPFRGKPFKIMLEKRRKDAPPPSSLVPGLPADLDALCHALLRRDPAQRPHGDELLAAVGLDSRLTTGGMMPVGVGRTQLIGRESALAELEQALTESKHGGPVLMAVHGSSGMGKSALLRRFLDPLLDNPDLMLLSGRCYERESVPYKAFDSLIDSLTQQLGQMPDDEVEWMLPPGLRPLTRLFPVLLHIDAIAVRSLPEDEPSDPRELRARGFRLMRSLFNALADRMRLVLHIDDLQWGDLDSATLLGELLRGPDAPPMLIIGSYRTEEVESSAFLQAMQRLIAQRKDTLRYRELEVGPLGEFDAVRLARSRLGTRNDASRLAALIARESKGNPFFIEALARHLHQTERLVEGGVTVEEVVQTRVDALDQIARRLMHALAVFGRPLDQRVAFDAAGVGGDVSARTTGLLRAEHLLRVRSTSDVDALEVYHDRIREAITVGLTERESRSVHLELGLALERRGVGDPETRAEHFLGAGDLERARRYTTESADRAAAALAFDRAAELYRRALALHRQTMGDAPSDEMIAAETRLLGQLGRALIDAGRGVEAADVLLETAERVDADERLDLTREAGAQLLIAGRLKRGLQLSRQVLEQIDMSMPPNTRRALLSLIAYRTRLRMRGMDFEEKPAEEIPRQTLLRIDACWSVALGLGLVDHVRAADFQTRSFLWALDAGEPSRVARAMAMEAAYAAATGPGGIEKAQRLSESARAITDRIGEPYAQGMAHYGTGVAHFLSGRWKSAVTELDQADLVFRERCRGANWETASTALMLFSAMAYLGEVGALAARVPALLAIARDRGNVYSATNLRTGYANLAWLVTDQPALAAQQHQEAMEEWGDDGFHVQHYFDLIAGVHLDLYRAQPESAWARARATWKPLRASLVHHVNLVNLDTLTLRARAALAAFFAGHDDKAGRVARKDARGLIRSGVPWAMAEGALFQGLLAAHAGDDEAARARFEEALTGFDDTETTLYAAATRMRLGALIDGDMGAGMRAKGETVMRDKGVHNPLAFARMLAPEWAPS